METIKDLAKWLEFETEEEYLEYVHSVQINGQFSCFMAEMKKLRDMGEIETIIDYLSDKAGGVKAIILYAKNI